MDLNIEALSDIRKNLLNWYLWKEQATILEINSHLDKLTEELCEHAKKVVAIEADVDTTEKHAKFENLEVITKDIQQIDFQETFDYVVIHSILEDKQSLEQILSFAKSHIHENSRILIAIDNAFGLQTFNTQWEPTSNQQIPTYLKLDKKSLEKTLQNQGLSNYKFYYPLPNLYTPNVIYTDQHMPSQESILRDLTIYSDNTVVVTDERNKYKDIIKINKDLFPILANSFLVEAGITPIQNDIQFISFGNSRKPAYRMKTIMKQDVVYKQPVQKEGEDHLHRIQNNITILNQSGFQVLDTFDDKTIYSKLIKQEKSFDKVLIHIADEQGTQALLEFIQKFYHELDSKLEKSTQKEQTVFEKYDIEITPQEKEPLHFVKHGIYDLIFQNAFYIENEFYFYDQEWIENDVPLEFILYRAIYYLGNSKNTIDTKMLYEILHIEPYIQQFEKLENILQAQIKDDRIWKIHAENFKTIQSIHDTCTHYKNLKDIAENQVIQIKSELAEEQKEHENQKALIEELKKQIEDLNTQIEYVINSKSWKMTEPLRNIRKKFNKM